MNLMMTVNPWSDEHLMFAQQMSATHILALSILPEGRTTGWDAEVLSAIRNRVEKAGLTFCGLDSIPILYDRAVLGATDLESDIDAVNSFLQQAGDAGIPQICYHWQTSVSLSTRRIPTGRGKSLVRAWENTLLIPAKASQEEDQAIRNRERLTRFLENILPTALEVGVQMIYSPTSPRTSVDILDDSYPNTLDDIKDLMIQIPSTSHKLDLNTGILFDLLDPKTDRVKEVESALRWFCQQKLIGLVSISNRITKASETRESFLDEGDLNLPRLIHILKDTGYTGPVRVDNQPVMDSDSSWGHKAQAIGAGYVRALIQAKGSV